MAPQSGDLTLYGDLMSQPTRAVLLFCRVNNVDVNWHRVNLVKGEHRRPEFKAINPLGKVPCIVDGRFKLAESHAIIKYLASTRPGVADHWYPSDAQRRAVVDAVLDWHHLNLRRGAMTVVFHRFLAPIFGVKSDPRVIAEASAVLTQSLDVVETVWLKEGYPFLAAGRQPSIADLSLACEIMQLQLLGEEDVAALLGPRKRVTAWIAAVKKATDPHFDEVHKMVHRAAARIAQERNAGDGDDKIAKPPVSKL